MKIILNQITTVIGVVFVLGYFAMFISLLTQPFSNQSLLRTQYIEKLTEVKNILKTKENELNSLKLQLIQKESVNKQQKLQLDEYEIKTNEVVLHSIPTTIAVRPGVIILGMHRSGTSVLGGLINKMGLNTGGPLIPAAEDNAKGFFERIDVVLQNDEIMKKQKVWYSMNTYKYDSSKGLSDVLSNYNENFFRNGRQGLAFLNDESNYPWMLKDPRLCITIRTWLPLLNFIPSVLFTYRHPLDVALSMHKREFEQYTIQRGLKLWYIYNKRAIQQSNDLCRVTSSHHAIMTQPQIELDRIYNDLNSCGVNVPHGVSNEDIDSFIDIKLQHGRSTLKDTTCEQSDLNTLLPPDTWETNDQSHIYLYRKCMIAYCAMEDGSAYTQEFEWDETINDA